VERNNFVGAGRGALLAFCLACLSGAAPAAVDAGRAAALGTQLTPVGAEPAPGTGAIGSPPQSQHGDGEFEAIVDPPTRIGAWPSPVGHDELAAEKPLFAITAVTLNRYREQLTDSHFALLLTNPNSFYMNVYAPRRTVRWPREIERATVANATRCRLLGTDEPVGCRLGFPFPIPQSGAEVIWNHKLRWRGDTISRVNNQLVVQPDGRRLVTRLAEDFHFEYANLGSPGGLDAGRRGIFRYVSEVLSPPRIAGNFVLMHERSGAGAQGRVAWAYRPGDARPRRAPRAAFDTVYEGSDGLQMFDQIDVFNGALELYDWTLVGKRELFVPYNAVLLDGADHNSDEVVLATHLNPRLLRYELHRVWVVEARLRHGQRHAMLKRRFYVDEDSWTILTVDILDHLGEAYQFQEAHLVYDAQAQRPRLVAEVIYNRETTRYIVSGLRLRDPPPEYGRSFAAGHFEPAALTRRALAHKR
jgi:hypothetical protein